MTNKLPFSFLPSTDRLTAQLTADDAHQNDSHDDDDDNDDDDDDNDDDDSQHKYTDNNNDTDRSTAFNATATASLGE